MTLRVDSQTTARYSKYQKASTTGKSTRKKIESQISCDETAIATGGKLQ
jgi:hypothetical protein